MSGREVAAANLGRPGDEPRCAYAMDALKRAMKWDEEAYGREYDLDRFMIVAVDDFNMGAMENKGLNIFNSTLRAGRAPRPPPTSTTRASRGSIAHEYFHNWTGNRITCRDWFQLSPEGGPDGLPRPAVLGRPAQRGRQADRGRDPPPRAPSSARTRARSPIRCGRPSTSRSTTSTPRPSTRRAPRSSACCGASSARRPTAQASTSTSSATTARPAPSRTGSRSSRRPRAATSRGSSAGTPRPARRASGLPRPGTARRYALDPLPDDAPTPGQPDKEPLVIPVAYGLLGPDGAVARRGRARARPSPSRPSPGTCPPARSPRSCAASRRR